MTDQMTIYKSQVQQLANTAPLKTLLNPPFKLPLRVVNIKTRTGKYPFDFPKTITADIQDAFGQDIADGLHLQHAEYIVRMVSAISAALTQAQAMRAMLNDVMTALLDSDPESPMVDKIAAVLDHRQAAS